MKKNIIKRSIITMAACLSLVSCMTDVDSLLPEMSADEICLERPMVLDGEDAATKAPITGALPDTRKIMLSASYSSATFFSGETFVKSGSTWSGSTTRYWPMNNALAFLAYSVDDALSSASGFSATWNSNAASGFTMAVPDNSSIQSDIVVAAKASASRGSAVGLTFSHVLSQIVFTGASDIAYNSSTNVGVSITGITISNVYNGGTLTATRSSNSVSQSWSLGSRKNVAVSGASADLSTSAAAVGTAFMAPPQTIPSITISYRLHNGKDGSGNAVNMDRTHTFTPTGNWAAGNKYTYAVSFSTGQISVSASVSAWTNAAQTWLYATGDATSFVGSNFGLTSGQPVYWRLDGSSSYEPVTYVEGTWGSSVKFEAERYYVTITKSGSTYTVSYIGKRALDKVTIHLLSTGNWTYHEPSRQTYLNYPTYAGYFESDASQWQCSKNHSDTLFYCGEYGSGFLISPVVGYLVTADYTDGTSINITDSTALSFSYSIDGIDDATWRPSLTGIYRYGINNYITNNERGFQFFLNPYALYDNNVLAETKRITATYTDGGVTKSGDARITLVLQAGGRVYLGIAATENMASLPSNYTFEAQGYPTNSSGEIIVPLNTTIDNIRIFTNRGTHYGGGSSDPIYIYHHNVTVASADNQIMSTSTSNGVTTLTAGHTGSTTVTWTVNHPSPVQILPGHESPTMQYFLNNYNTVRTNYHNGTISGPVYSDKAIQLVKTLNFRVRSLLNIFFKDSFSASSWFSSHSTDPENTTVFSMDDVMTLLTSLRENQTSSNRSGTISLHIKYSGENAEDGNNNGSVTWGGTPMGTGTSSMPAKTWYITNLTAYGTLSIWGISYNESSHCLSFQYNVTRYNQTSYDLADSNSRVSYDNPILSAEYTFGDTTKKAIWVDFIRQSL